MPNKIKLQDLSISDFDQHLDVTGVSGGACFTRRRCVLWWCWNEKVCRGAGSGNGGGGGGGW